MKRRNLVRGALAAPFVLSLAELSGQARAQGATDMTLRIANGSELDTLDPHAVLDVARLHVKQNTYDSLFRFLGNPAKLMPWLAESYERSPDGLHYRLKLVEGAKFHDGSAFTADDVVYSVDRMLGLNQGPARLFVGLLAPGSTKAIDAHTVEFTLTGPAAPFASMLPEIYIVNSRIVRAQEKNGDFAREWLARNTAGSGSYHVTTWDPAVGYEAERFHDHFKPWVDKAPEVLRFRTIRETNSQTLAILRGDVDLWQAPLTADQLDRVSKAPNLATERQESPRQFFINFNTQKPPFNDVHVRRAISMAFDYDGWLNGIMRGVARRSTGPIPVGEPGSTPTPIFNYDIKAAKAELAKASKPIDRPVTIDSMAGYPRAEQAAQVLQAGLRELGIDARIISETWPTLANRCRTVDSTPDMMTIWQGGEYMDTQNWVGDSYDSARHGNWKSCSYYTDAAVSAELQKAYVLNDEAERTRLYAEAARKVEQDAPTIYVHKEDWVGVHNKRVQGYEYCPVGGGNNLRGIWLKT
jgi:peptide/nickel transport system substrate-binding protein